MLNDKHRAEIEASVTQTALGARITSLNFSTIDSHEIPRVLNRGGSKWKQKDYGPGWIASGVDPKDGQPTMLGVQVKLDNPTTAADGKPIKYLAASDYPSEPVFLDSGSPDYWPSVQANPTQYRWICEGVKKAACLMALGQPAISMPGVYNWGVKGRMKANLARFVKGARVALCLDMDWQLGKDGRPNINVLNAVGRLAREIIKQGGIPAIIHWDVSSGQSRAKGIDDFLMQLPEGDRAFVIEGLLEDSWNLQQFLDATKSLDHSRDDDGLKPKLVKDYELIKEKIGGRIRFNELRHVVEFDGQEIDLGYARRDLMIDHGLMVKGGDTDVAGVTLKIAKQNSYHPVKDYLDAVAEEHGGTDYSILTNIAERYFGASDPIYSIFVIRFLIGAVARIYDPGCKLDCALILQGKQGDYKSTWFKTLSSASWFDDSLGDMTDKDEKLKMHRVWFSEWAELEAVFKRKDVASVKATISSGVDQLRPPYERMVRDFPRRSVIVGSTNEDEFLADSTGNRRYWVVPVTRRIPIELLERERDQIWAAARALYFGCGSAQVDANGAVIPKTGGEQWHLTDGEDKWQIKSVGQFQTDEIWSATIAKWLKNPRERETQASFEYVTTPLILLHAVGQELERLDRGMQMRVADTMKRLGWKSVQKRVDGVKQRVWEPTQKWEESQAVSTSDPCPNLSNEVGTAESLTTPRLYQLSQPIQPNCYREDVNPRATATRGTENQPARGDFDEIVGAVGTIQAGRGFEDGSTPEVGRGSIGARLGQPNQDAGFGEISTSSATTGPTSSATPHPTPLAAIGARVLFPAPGTDPSTTPLVEGVIDGIRPNPVDPNSYQYHCQNGTKDDWCIFSDLRVRD